MHWATEYIGLPWSATGEGPDSFHCWAFVRHIQRQHYGRALPVIENPEDLRSQARAFADHEERLRWPQVDAPQDGDCVLMSRNKVPVHVGVWVDADGSGGVLHCAQGAGVVYQRIEALKANGWNITGYYRFKD